MSNIKRITANLPEDLLSETTYLTGKGITETLIEGLRLIKLKQALPKAQNLKGKLKLEIDLEVSRERNRR